MAHIYGLAEAQTWSVRLSHFVTLFRNGDQNGHAETKFDVETEMLEMVRKFSELKTGDAVKEGKMANSSPPYIVVVYPKFLSCVSQVLTTLRRFLLVQQVH